MSGTSAQFEQYVPPVVTIPPAPRALGVATGNLWDLTERLHIDLQRTTSSACRR